MFHHEWALWEGLHEYYAEVQGSAEGVSPEYEAQPHQGGPRPYYPSRHEKMATGEELMALGINYTRE